MLQFVISAATKWLCMTLSLVRTRTWPEVILSELVLPSVNDQAVSTWQKIRPSCSAVRSGCKLATAFTAASRGQGGKRTTLLKWGSAVMFTSSFHAYMDAGSLLWRHTSIRRKCDHFVHENVPKCVHVTFAF